MKSSTTPSRQLIFSLGRKHQRNRLARTENITRLEKTVVSTRNVHMVKVAPKMSVVSTKQVSARWWEASHNSLHTHHHDQSGKDS